MLFAVSQGEAVVHESGGEEARKGCAPGPFNYSGFHPSVTVDPRFIVAQASCSESSPPLLSCLPLTHTSRDREPICNPCH